MGDYRKAIDDLTEALAAKPKDAIALSRRGQAHEALGDLRQALDDFRDALDIDSELESAEEGFARITAQLRHSDK